MTANPLATALRFVFEKNNRVPGSALPAWEPALDKPDGTDLSTTWLGHSTLLIALGPYRILTDPVLVKKVTPLGPTRFKGTLPLSAAQMPPLDLVIISHDHYDHLNRPSIITLKDKARTFAVPRGIGKHLRKWGVSPQKILEMGWWEHRDPVPGIQVMATPACHFSGRGLFDRNHSLWASWVIRSGNRRLFFSGDSGYFSGFAEIGNAHGPFDITFLECGAYDPAWQKVHMTPEQTVQAHLDLKGGILHPVHWSTFNLAFHPWYEPMERLTTAAEKAGITIATPGVGQTLDHPLNPAGFTGSPNQGQAWWKAAMSGQITNCPDR